MELPAKGRATDDTDYPVRADARNLPSRQARAGAGAGLEYRRISDAVVRARADRASGAVGPEQAIEIHVAPGTYVGSFDATELQNHPEYEVLPIILNVPNRGCLGSDERAVACYVKSCSHTTQFRTSESDSRLRHRTVLRSNSRNGT